MDANFCPHRPSDHCTTAPSPSSQTATWGRAWTLIGGELGANINVLRQSVWQGGQKDGVCRKVSKPGVKRIDSVQRGTGGGGEF